MLTSRQGAQPWREKSGFLLQPGAECCNRGLRRARLRDQQEILQIELENGLERALEPLRFEIVERIDESAERDTAAGGGRLQRQVTVIEMHAGLRVDAAHTRGAKPLGPSGRAPGAPHGVVVEQRHAREVREPPDPVLADEHGTGNGRNALAEQRDCPNAIEPAAPNAHRGVDFVLVEIDRLVAGLQPQVEARAAPREAAEPRHEPARRECRSRAEGKHAATVLRAQQIDAAREPVEAFTEVIRRELPLVGEHQSTRGATEQRDAEIFLEPADLVTDRCGRHVQFACCLGEAEQPGRGLEGAQCRQWRQRSRHL